MRPGQRLTTLEYDQRLDEITDAFGGLYGEVTFGHAESRNGRLRKLRVTVDVPGYGPPTVATMVLVESHVRPHDVWERVEYVYDLHLEPRPAARYAYHWHDDLPHRHCVEVPELGHHYEGVFFDDIGWAAQQLFVMTITGISCHGLRPLRADLAEP